jgi:hypothetical protein
LVPSVASSTNGDATLKADDEETCDDLLQAVAALIEEEMYDDNFSCRCGHTIVVAFGNVNVFFGPARENGEEKDSTTLPK